MDLSGIKYVYLLGIGGIGMSALARYFYAKGKIVSGYDKTSTPLTDTLVAEGISIHFDDNMDLALSSINSVKGLEKSHILIVYTPAIPQKHSEFNYFKDNGYSLKKRSEVLGLITKDCFTVAVAGTHGKTSTSALIAHIMKDSGMDCHAFVGGIMSNYNTNILIGKINPSPVEKGKNAKSILVVEADEYDRSFLALHPDIAVITSMDADHLDIYGEKKNLIESFNLFAQQVKPGGILIHKKGLPVDGYKGKFFSYSTTENANFRASKIKISEGRFVFDVQWETPSSGTETRGWAISPAAIGKADEIKLKVPGRHNVENALAAFAVALEIGIPEQKIIKAMESFGGVKRRFEYILQEKNIVFIDDYAHHPAELSACIGTARELFSPKKITGIFQPHLFSRTRDFADEFARALELLDEVILLDIYPARELPIDGVNSEMLLKKIGLKDKILCRKENLEELISKKKIEVLLTLGAGDIDALVRPVSEVLQKKYGIKKKR